MSDDQNHLLDSVTARPRRPNGEPVRAHVVAIASGQAGVGKTNIAMNLAIALSTRGLRVCVLDADARPANIHALLGYTPRLTLEHLMASDSRTIDDVLADGPSGIKVLPNAAGIADYVSLDEDQQHRLLRALDSLERRFDYIFIDTAAGVRNTVLYFLQAAQHTLMVLTPEPKTLSGAFATLQALGRRGGLRPVHVLVNMVRDYEESRNVFRRFASTVEKYLRLRVDYLGFIRIDETVTSSVELKRPVILLKHRAPASRCFFELAADLVRQSATWKTTASFAQFWLRLTGQPHAPEPTEHPPTGEFRRPRIEPPPEPKLSRYTITRAALSLVEDKDVQPDDAEVFLSGLLRAFTDRFGRYPFKIRDVLLHVLELDDYPRAEIRQLAMLLDDLHERRYQRPIHGLESSVMRLFALVTDSDERIVQLAEQLRTHYQTRFGKRLFDPVVEVLTEARSEQRADEELAALVRELAEVYEERFGKSALTPTPSPDLAELRRVVETALADQRRLLSELEGVLTRLDELRPEPSEPV